MTLPGVARTEAVAFILVLSRIGGIFFLAPVFSSRIIPARAKLIAALAISLALTPIAEHGQRISDDPIVITQLLVKEIGIGLAFALALGTITAAVQAAGSLIDTLAGFSFGAIIDPMSGVNAAVLSQLYSVFTALVLVLSGGDRLMIEALARSYTLVPLGTMPQPGRLAGLATNELSQLALVGVELAAPVVVALVVADASFGLVARAVPQMNVFVVALPAKIILTFAIVAASLPVLALHLQDQLNASIQNGLAALVP
ncbi:MAG TPA: flagellar biosynthetic protein FliR [Gaiellaceae bacterium]|jgi:flagellar biosynthetic protein FliR|nr:flagellar biosynthetic protein FliR [Gaiellaceae bacterium]